MRTDAKYRPAVGNTMSYVRKQRGHETDSARHIIQQNMLLKRVSAAAVGAQTVKG